MRAISSSSRLMFCVVFSILAAMIAGAPAAAQQAIPAQTESSSAPSSASATHTPIAPLITQLVNETQLTTLKGNVHPLARPQFDLGTAPASLPMQRMLLVLKRNPDQEYALRKLLDDQQDKRSPSYHKWLTPEAYGKQFGPTDSDMQAITAWLQSHGFELGAPSKGRSVIEFSGSASQVQEAFHTAIHKYLVNGEQHWANASDPQIPAALAPAVAGVLTLHNFLKRPFVHLSLHPTAAKFTPGKSPYVTFPAQGTQPAINALGPQDYATIYNINPVYNSPSFNQGSNITIGIIGRSDLYSESDVSDFLSSFGLAFPNFDFILNGPDPGDLGGGEEAEATLDVTWSSAIAPGANVDFVVSASTNTADGIDLSEVYIVENNLADVMTESFGSCEYFNTDAQIAGTNALAEQAAAQGITYFVSTGDSGAEGCDDPNFEAVATGPVSVNVLASTPFTTAVGGTMFNENGQDATYWSSFAPPAETAISYIPENVWNEGCDTSTCANISAGSGGASAGNILDTAIGGTTPGILKPAWQSGVTGIPNDRVRDLPDVSLTAASHDPYLLCLESSCSQGFIYFVWGTSAAAPSFAGIMALVENQMLTLNPGLSPRQGQANYILYRLAASENSTLSQCNGSSTSSLPGSACIFHDVTVGNNAVPGEINYGLSTAQYQAGVGYDLASGLGSVNVANLVSRWNSVTFNPTTTTLALSPLVNITHGSLVSVNIAVAPSSGTGTPTGDVSLLATGTGSFFDGRTGVDDFTLSNGTIAQSTGQLPGGAYTVTAHYAGDAIYAPSDSTPVSVTVTPEPSTTTVSVLTFDSQGNQFNFTSGPYGSFVYLRADVAGQSGHGTPTGTVNFADTFGAIPGGNSFQLNAGDTLNNGSNTATPNGVITFDTGTHTLSASYTGDTSFNASASTTPLTFTITPGFFATIPTSGSQVSISAPGGTGSTSITVSNSTGFTGTINFACSGLPAEATCAFSPASVVASGTASTTSPTITVTTTAAHTTQNLIRNPYYLARWLSGGGFMLAGFFMVGLSTGRRRSATLLLIVLAMLVVVPACGGGGGSKTAPPVQDPGTPAGTYNITVTATSGSAVSTTGFTLFLQ